MNSRCFAFLLVGTCFVEPCGHDEAKPAADARARDPGPGVEGAKVSLRVAGAQIPVSSDASRNVEVISRALEFAAREKADVLVTPEGSLSGYTHDFSGRATAEALETLLSRARKAGVALVLGTCFEEADGGRYDQQRFYDRRGEYLGFHSKILLCRRMADPQAKGEIDFFRSTSLRTFKLEGLTVGGLVCNDMWANPEWTPMPDPFLARQLAGLGARVIFLSVNAGQDEGEALALNRGFHESNLRLRARSAGVWVVVADAADPEGRKSSNCPSGVLGPDGRWALQVEPRGEHFFAHTIEVELPGSDGAAAGQVEEQLRGKPERNPLVPRTNTPGSGTAARKSQAHPLAAPGVTSLVDQSVRFAVAQAHHVHLQRGPVSAIIVDNEAVDVPSLPGHRAGYNGVASLKHSVRAEDLFVPAFGGLNFEHIHDGTLAVNQERFEPRRAPMQLRVIDEFTVELHQRPTPNWQLESCGRYHLLPDGTIEYTFECIPRAATFQAGFIGLFWASYIDSPEDKAIFFRGRDASRSGSAGWLRAVTPAHGVDSTHPPAGAPTDFPFDSEFPLTLANHRSRYVHTEPWYYGVSHGVACVQMFRERDRVWFAQSPTGGGATGANPAWDFQWFIPNWKVGEAYGFVMRMAYLPFESREQIEKETRPHRAALR
jgi:predicted amidohydrolase